MGKRQKALKATPKKSKKQKLMNDANDAPSSAGNKRRKKYVHSDDKEEAILKLDMGEEGVADGTGEESGGDEADEEAWIDAMGEDGGTGVGDSDGEGSEDGVAYSEVEGEGDDHKADQEKTLLSDDPFVHHFMEDLAESDVEELEATFSKPLKYQHSVDPILCGVSEATCLPSRTPKTLDMEGKTLSELNVKSKLCDAFSGTKSASKFSALQKKLFAIMASYKDLQFSRRTFANGEKIRKVYLLHALNHILKTRSRVLKNNARLAQAAKEGKEIEELRDQGLTRPKVLILLPFREAALRTVNMIIQLLLPQGQGQVNRRKRFLEEFSEEEHVKPKIRKPASYESTFAGNIDDCFRVGIAIKRNAINLFSDFYSSDLLVASPLGLRTIIGAKGDKKRDYDFLSSLEIIIVDQADVYLMQNWEHILHLFEHTHLQPLDAHGVDFSRVNMWALNGWSKFYRQTLIFGEFETPEINSLFSTHARNYAGRVKVCETFHDGTLSETTVQVPHVFHRFSCDSHMDLPKARLAYFVDKILPDFSGELKKRTCILVPSYLDFVHLRSHMSHQEMDFVEINEYTKNSDVSRARTKFFHGGSHFMLYTERLHFFRRLKIRGICHIIFYSLPIYAEFYPELVNFLSEMAKVEGVSCTVVFSNYDSLSLCRVVGTKQAKAMVTSQDSVFTLFTGSI